MIAAALLVLTAVPWALASADALFGERWRFGQAIEPLEPVRHRPIYALPLSYDERAPDEVFLPRQGRADMQRAEFVYQFSVKTALATDLLDGRGDLWLGYTQKGWWQAYNRSESNPFRETNYEPELIYAHRPAAEIFGIAPRLLTVRLNHLSDGRGRYNSRSFNRLGAGLLFDDGDQAFYYRVWYPLPAGGSVDGDVIADYYGRAQMDWYRADGASSWHVMLRNNLRLQDNRTSLAVDYSFPTASPYVDGFIEYRHGYGGGLADYDRVSNRLSIGALFVRWH